MAPFKENHISNVPINMVSNTTVIRSGIFSEICLYFSMYNF